MRYIFFVLIFTLVGCNIVNNTNEGGSLNLSVSRELAGLEIHLSLKHEDGYSLEKIFTDSIIVEDLRPGEWIVSAVIYNDAGIAIKKGLTYATMRADSSTEIVLPLASIGSGQLELNLDFNGEIPEYLEVIAYDTATDYNSPITVFQGSPGGLVHSVSPQEIPSGLYEIISTLYRGDRMVGGNSTMAIVDNGTLTTTNISLHSDMEYSINSNVLYRLNVKTKSGGSSLGIGNIYNYRIYDFDPGPGKDHRYDLTETFGTGYNTMSIQQLCNSTLYIESGVKKVRLIVDYYRPDNTRDSDYSGEIILSFGQGNRGNFELNSENGEWAKGEFVLHENNSMRHMDYFFIENRFALLEMVNNTAYGVHFTQELDPRDYSFSFYSSPFVDLTTSGYQSDNANVSSPFIQQYDSFATNILEPEATPEKKYRVEFYGNGVSSHIQYNFYSRYKGLAEYYVTDGAGGTISGLAPFNFYTFEALPFNMYDGSHKRFRRNWGYTSSIWYGGSNILGTDTVYALQSDQAGSLKPVTFDIAGNGYGSISIDMSLTGAANTYEPLFDNVDYLGIYSTGERLFKGYYHDDGTRNDNYLSSMSTVFIDNEATLILADFSNMTLKAYWWRSSISSTITASNLAVTLSPP